MTVIITCDVLNVANVIPGILYQQGRCGGLAANHENVY